MGKINKKNLQTVSFDEEIVTKNSANELLSKVAHISDIKNVASVEEENTNIVTKNGSKTYNLNETLTKNRKEKRKKLNKQVMNENNNKNESPSKTKSKHTKRKLVTNDEQNLRGQSDIEEQNDDEDEFEGKKSKQKKKNDKSSKKPEVNDEQTDEVSVENPKEKTSESHSKSKSKHTKRKLATNEEQNEDKDESERKIAKQKKKNKSSEKSEVNDEQTDEVSVENPKVKTSESIRAQKRKKHAKLLEEKRLKTEVVTQQNVLNYLSKWKHCRTEWKFEKLKQIWLQQNLFDATKLPNEFWDTAVEYFNGSKGFIRNVVLRDALKIIEKEDSTEEENTDENYLLILKRARDIVQHLQE